MMILTHQYIVLLQCNTCATHSTCCCANCSNRSILDPARVLRCSDSCSVGRVEMMVQMAAISLVHSLFSKLGLTSASYMDRDTELLLHCVL